MTNFGNVEAIDPQSPASVSTAIELEAEIDRLRSFVPPPLQSPCGSDAPSRLLDHWRVRLVDERVADVAAVDEDEFRPVDLPFTAESAWVHLRHDFSVDRRGSVLRFTAADYEATVFVDGVVVGHHIGYFAPFEIDLSTIPAGDHVLDVLVRRANDYVRWSGEVEVHNHGDAHGKGLGSVVGDAVTAGAGLLGPVHQVFRSSTHFVDLMIQAPATGDVTVSAEIASVSGDAELHVEVLDHGVVVASARSHIVVSPSGRQVVEAQLTVPAARQWSPQDPYLYEVHASVRAVDGEETVVERVGFRTVERWEDGTLLLNGVPFHLRGTTSIGCLWSAGWAGNEEAVIRQLLVAKALNANALRVHVHVLPRLVYECADRIGLLIYQDAPLQWHCFEHEGGDLTAALGQSAELARVIRHHPSVVIVSLVNEMHMAEPFHESDTEYVRQSQQVTAALAPGVLLFQDWSGPTRPRELPQSFHDYPGYFFHTSTTEHSVLDWAGEGTRAIISEYGGGAVPSWRAMREAVVAHERAGRDRLTLPDSPEGPWTAEEGLLAQTGEMLDNHQRMVGLQPSFEDYRRASGVVQARVLRAQTLRMRRDPRIIGVIQHYLRNPASQFYNPWVDLAIIDSAGELTAGFDALREAFRPLCVDVVGIPVRAYSGAVLEPSVWIDNDLAQPVETRVVTTATTEDGTRIGSWDHVVFVGATESVRRDGIAVAIPEGVVEVTVTVEVFVGDDLVATQANVVRVYERPERLEVAVSVLGDVSVLEQRAPWISDVQSLGEGPAARCILVEPQKPLDQVTRDRLREHAAAGGLVVLLERPPLESLAWVNDRIPAIVSQRQTSELAAIDMSLVESGLTTEDLSRWGNGDGSVVTDPLVGADRRGGPVWARTGHRLQLAAIQEFSIGRGSILVSQLHVWRWLGIEPIAAEVLRALVTARHRSL